MGSPENLPSPPVDAPAPPVATQYKPQFTIAAPKSIPVKPKEQQTALPTSAIDIVRPMIRDYESFRPDAYLDSTGKWTIGYGQTEINGRPVREGDRILKSDAEKWSDARLQRDFDVLSKRKGFAALKPHEQAAILDIAYNVGSNFDVTDPITGKYKFPDTRAALDDPKLRDKFIELIPQFRRSNGVILDGLVSRRRDTLDMFKGLFAKGYKTRNERMRKMSETSQP